MIDTSLITAGMKAFMTELIDYAGLFPPAGLPLEEAVENYARYRQQPDAWMLSRFIIPASRLSELTTIAGDRFQTDDPFRFSILGSGGQDSADFLEAIQTDIESVNTFRADNGSGVTADFYEVRLPESVVAKGDVMEMNGMVSGAANMLVENGMRPFFETTLGPNWRDMVAVTVQTIAGYNNASGQKAGFKLRCGGLDAAAFPSQYQVAHVIAICRDAGVPLKCTAGLHHPIRHYDETVRTKMHGFVNVFVAGIIAQSYHLPEHEIAAVIADENHTHFVFEDKSLTWLDRVVSNRKNESIRRENMISFVS
jgi:hypothetical protein